MKNVTILIQQDAHLTILHYCLKKCAIYVGHLEIEKTFYHVLFAQNLSIPIVSSCLRIKSKNSRAIGNV